MQSLFALCLVLCSIPLVAGLKPLYEPNGVLIPGQFIVVLRSNVTAYDFTSLVSNIPDEQFIASYDIGSFKGFAATLSDEFVQKLRDHDAVEYIEKDQVMTASEACARPQQNSVWNLVRVSEHALSLSPANYYYGVTAGAGVDAYIIDTGILTTHVDFGGRAIFGTSLVSGETTSDCNGHGTHVAGTVAGTTYGLAKRATLIAVKVLNCAGSGSTSGVISGINWATSNKLNVRRRPSVANLSLGGSFSSALNSAVTNMVAAGIITAVAAGNSNANACNYSPASTPSAITVGATTNTDARSSFSNFGTCVDIFAPGTNIKSDWIGSTTATNTISGTSMASPHVAGAAALYIAKNPSATPAAVIAFLNSVATLGVVTGPGAGSPNRLLYSPC